MFYVVLRSGNTGTDEDTHVNKLLNQDEPSLSRKELQLKTSKVIYNQTVGVVGKCLNYTAPILNYTSTAKQHIVFAKVHKAARLEDYFHFPFR